MCREVDAPSDEEQSGKGKDKVEKEKIAAVDAGQPGENADIPIPAVIPPPGVPVQHIPESIAGPTHFTKLGQMEIESKSSSNQLEKLAEFTNLPLSDLAEEGQAQQGAK